jgi:hypothetical protein
MVLGRDIASGVQVGIEMISTVPTNEHTLGTAVGAGAIPTAATHLRGMPGIDPSHPTTPFLGLVRDKALELSKRPGVHPTPGFGLSSHLHPLTNVFEVFQHDRRAWRGGLNDLFGKHMIAVAPEAPLSVAKEFQVPFGRLCALLLQYALEMKQPPFD